MEPIPATPTHQPATAEGGTMTQAEGQQGRSMPPPPATLTASPPAAPPSAPPANPGTPGAPPVTPAQVVAPPAVCEPSNALQHRAPDVEHTAAGRQTIRFLDFSVTVSRTMALALRRVEDDLLRQYQALPCDERPATLREWAGLTSIGGYDSTRRSGHHLTGDAVDCSYHNQPYIPTRNFVAPRGSTDGRRTAPRYGGEAAPRGDRTEEEHAAYRAEIEPLRGPAVEVMDRATVFMSRNPYDPSHAELHNRETDENITHAYRRFADASNNLRDYMRLAFRSEHDAVTRRPIANAQTVAEAELLRRIPETERLSETEGVARIQALMNDEFWHIIHAGETRTARQIYIQILRDYETVRIPLQRGNPSATPGNTRNPANGFLQLPEHFVRSMVEVGNLRWGACMFGASASGDVHHFDTAAWTSRDASANLNHSDDDGL